MHHMIALSLLVATLAGCAAPRPFERPPFVSRPYWVELTPRGRVESVTWGAEGALRGAAKGAVIGGFLGAPLRGAAAGAAVGWMEGRTLGARAAREAGRREQRLRWIWEQQRRTAAAYEQALAGGPSTPGYR